MIDSAVVNENLVSLISKLSSQAGSLRELGRQTGVHHDTMRQWMKGASPSLDKLIAIAAYAELSLEELGAILERGETPLSHCAHCCENRFLSQSAMTEQIDLEPKARRRLHELWAASLAAQELDEEQAITLLEQYSGGDPGSIRLGVSLIEEEEEVRFSRGRLSVFLPLLRRVRQWQGDRPILSEEPYESLEELLRDLINGNGVKV